MNYCVNFILSISTITLSQLAFSQTKIITEQELGVLSGVYFSATMDQPSAEITITMKGPDDRWFGTGFGFSMFDADVLIYTDGKVGAMHPLGTMDYYMNSNSAMGITVDTSQDWTIISNTTSAGVRTIQASRALNTGDSDDHVLNFSDASLNVIWAKFYVSGYTLDYHGAANRGTVTLNWQIPDLVAPSLIVNPFVPNDDQTDVTLSTDLIVNFDENIVVGTGNIELRLLATNTVVESFNVTTDAQISGSQLTLNPSSYLLSFTDYYVVIPNGAIEDSTGNIYSGFTDNATWNFTTLDLSTDITQPSIGMVPFSPADNSVDIDLNSVLTVSFDEDIMAGNGSLELHLSSTGGIVESFDIQGSSASIVGVTVEMTPTTPLSLFTEYYMTIANGAIEDLAGNSYVGFSDSTTWNFRTANDIGLLEESNEFLISLNADKFIQIKTALDQEYSIRLLSITGQVIWSDDHLFKSSFIDVSQFANSIVIIQVSSEHAFINKMLRL